jgi:hypothetical protein
MVWVIDNSGSMGNKIAQVRANVGSFLASVKDRADIRAVFVTQAGTSSLAYTLPPEAVAAGHVQIDLNVQSYNDLAIAAASVCPEETTNIDVAATGGLFGASPDTVTICGQSISNRPAAGVSYALPPPTLEDPADVVKARGLVRPHLRKGARLMFVMVSDEDSSIVNGANFLSLIKPHVADPKPRVFSFTGLAASTGTCALIVKGASYESLASATGAAAFDICAPDWSPNFGQLTARTLAAADTEFALRGSNVTKIVSVVLDGKTLPASAYQLEDGVVVLQPSAVPTSAKSLSVTYRMK